ncbi:uncharacterized protein [Prorops nasuta]|uniref:uncharacterized protein n=1 Tax=Prorops nasuta TaxID=863751 RepID=UPI0034CFB160
MNAHEEEVQEPVPDELLIDAEQEVLILDPEGILENQENENTALHTENFMPITETEVVEFDCLDEDILNLLGKDSTKSGKVEAKFHPSLEKRWWFWLESGLPKEEKLELLKKYERPILFEAPKLNKEITSLIGETGIKRDNYFCDQQNSLGSALVSLGTTITSLLNSEDQLNKIELLERLGDTGKLMSNLQFELTKVRKSFITPGLSKSMRSLFSDRKSGTWLFGPNLREDIKDAKSMEKLAQEMKGPVCEKIQLQSNGLEEQELHPTTLLCKNGKIPIEVSQRESSSEKGPIQENLKEVSTRAGRLKRFYESWKTITLDKFVLDCIRGYKILFNCKPSGFENRMEPKRSDQDSREIGLAIEALIKKGAVVQCKFQAGQFLSSYFVIPKANGGRRFILNLKKLNSFISTSHFKMEDIRTAIRLIRKNFYMGLLDLEDAYFLVPVHKNCRKYLRFKFKNITYEFTCLPFGLCTAPFVFTKLMKPVVARLRAQGLLSVVYLDDLLCIGQDEISCKENIHKTVILLESLGFIINFQKSKLFPSRECQFLGFIMNSIEMTLQLPEKKKDVIKNTVRSLSRKEVCSIRDLSHVIGLLVAASQAIRYAWTYIRGLENLKYVELARNGRNYDATMTLSTQSRRDLLWFEMNIDSVKNTIVRDCIDCEIYTDASTSGWGALYGDKRIHGFWSVEDLKNHINFLELLAVYKALKTFSPLLKKKNILLRVDNTTAIAYINKAGGVKFEHLNKLAREIWQWAEENDAWLLASYIPSKENKSADELSRISNMDVEWELASYYFDLIIQRFGEPEIDLFASQLNKKCVKYFTWQQEPGAFTIDAFTMSWKDMYLYAFPPFSMVLRTLMKIIEEKAEGIICHSSVSPEPITNCSQGIRLAFLKENIEESTVNILLASLADGTKKRYEANFIKWKHFCDKTNTNPFQPSLEIVLKFFTEKFKNGASYGMLNMYRAMISFISRGALTNNNIISRFMKGVCRLRPQKPKYEYVWDVSLVLEVLEKWFPLKDLMLQKLSEKTLMLLALATGHRVQTLGAIKVRDIKIGIKEVTIHVTGFLKTSGPGRSQPLIVLPFLTDKPELYVAGTLVHYLSLTNSLREGIDSLFITHKKPFRGASTQTLSRWLKTTLTACGVDTSVFKAHSVRHASTSKAFSKGVDIELIRKSAGWTKRYQAFQKFYNRPIQTVDNSFVASILT